MERFSQRESLLLGYSPQRSLMNSGSSPSSSNKTSDVDFHDVFGGPPRRSSTHETRYSFNGVTDTNVFKEDDDEAWSGLGEKPVFGEESMNRRRTQSDDFFDDIFRGNNSVSSSSRRFERDPFSSAPGSRVLSPVRSLPLKAEISEGSSLPTQFSLPARLTKAVDVPTIGSTGRTTSLSRFSNQAIQSPEDSRNDIRSYLRQSSLSREFSLGGEGSSTLGTPDRADTGSNFGKDAKSSENPTSGSPFQFHFSIYKWASKGVPIVIPHWGRLGSRVQESTKNEESQPSTNESPANESTGRQSPKSTLPTIDSPSNDHWLGDATLEPNKQENDLLLDESTPDKVESEALSSLHDTVEAVSGNTVSYHTIEDIEPPPLLQTAPCEDPQKETPVLMEHAIQPEKKPSLFIDSDLQQGSDERIKAGGRKENMVTGTKKSSADVGSDKLARTRSGKRSSTTNSNEVDRAIFPGSPRNSRDNPRRSNVKGKVKDFVSSSTNSNEVDRAIFPGSPRNSRDNPGGSNAKGKVKDFVKMFSQEVLCKSTYVGDLGSQSSKMKDKGIFKAEKEVIISATRMDEDLQQSTVRTPFPDASKTINEDLKQLKKEHREVKTVDDILSNASGKDVLASRTGSVPNGSKAIIGDADDCFQIKELPEEEKKQPQAGNCHEEIRAIDAKIRRWSRGKEGNIRSLLTTMQDVLWPESGWKTVPLVDIIEGNSVKRTYQRALLCLHPDKLQQKGAPSHHKYLAAKVFDILQEAWNHFNSLGPL